jgi:hypothetical protein
MALKEENKKLYFLEQHPELAKKMNEYDKWCNMRKILVSP